MKHDKIWGDSLKFPPSPIIYARVPSDCLLFILCMCVRIKSLLMSLETPGAVTVNVNEQCTTISGICVHRSRHVEQRLVAAANNFLHGSRRRGWLQQLTLDGLTACIVVPCDFTIPTVCDVLIWTSYVRCERRFYLLGPFYGAIAVPSVTRCRRCRCRGHRCAGGVRQ